ncbi:MAG: iron-sulfur cluster assembly scaffold protein [Rhodospirillaceae bacterium]|nr:iron-sulfur cluster assembly scaffold protein [Rhodospirillaceae bacterium]
MDNDSQVRQLFLSAHRAGPLNDATSGLVSGEAEDRTLNVWVRFQLRILHGAIHTVRYNIYGCPHTVAAAEWTAEWLEGRPAEALKELSMRECLELLGIPVEKLGKLLLLEDALAACRSRLDKYKD